MDFRRVCGHDAGVLRTVASLALLTVPATAGAATNWLPPVPLAAEARGGGPPAVAGDGEGRVVAAWATARRVMVALRTPGGPWYQPVAVPGSSRGATEVTVAMTDRGLAAVAWIERGRMKVSVRPARKRFLVATTVSSAGRVAASPRITLAGPCAPLATWAEESASASAPAIRVACAAPSGRWGSIRTVSATREYAFTPDVAAASSGRAVVVWRQDDGDKHRVRAAIRSVDGTFTAAEDLSTAGPSVLVDPSVAMTPSGDAVAAWTITRGSDSIAQAALRPATGGWTRAEDLSRPGGVARGARVAVDATGSAVATWVRDGVVQAALRPAAQTWTPPRDLSDVAVTAGSPHLALSGTGAAVVAWPAISGTDHVAQAALRLRGGDFGTPTTITDPRHPAIAPQGAIGDDGVAPVVWQSTNPAVDPIIAASGVSTATGLAGSSAATPVLVDLRARPARVSPGQRIRITFGLSQSARVRLSATRAKTTTEAGAITVSGADGANLIALEGRLGGASLGRGRWVLTATPRGGTARSLVLLVR